MSIIQTYKRAFKKRSELKLKRSFLLIDLDTAIMSRKNTKKSINIIQNRLYNETNYKHDNLEEVYRISDNLTKSIQQLSKGLKKVKSDIKVIDSKLSQLVK